MTCKEHREELLQWESLHADIELDAITREMEPEDVRKVWSSAMALLDRTREILESENETK